MTGTRKINPAPIPRVPIRMVILHGVRPFLWAIFRIWLALLTIMWVGYIILSIFGMIPDPEPVPFQEQRMDIDIGTRAWVVPGSQMPSERTWYIT